jgi:hypothetical protein
MNSETIFKLVSSLPAIGLTVVAYTHPSVMTIIGACISSTSLKFIWWDKDPDVSNFVSAIFGGMEQWAKILSCWVVGGSASVIGLL